MHQKQQTVKGMDIDVNVSLGGCPEPSKRQTSSGGGFLEDPNLHTDSSDIPTHKSDVEPGPSHRAML